MISWLKKIFKVEVIGVIIAVGGVFVTLPQFIKDTGGAIDIKYDSFFKDDIPKVIIVDSTTTDFISRIFPTLYNDGKYSLDNFLLTYTINSSSEIISYNEKFNISNNRTEKILTYDGHIFYSHSELAPPYISMSLTTDTTFVDYSIKATFDGVRDPYIISNSIKVIYIPVQKSYEQWEQLAINSSKGLHSAYSYVDNNFNLLNNSSDASQTQDTSIIKSKESKWNINLNIIGFALLTIGLFLAMSYCIFWGIEKYNIEKKLENRYGKKKADEIFENATLIYLFVCMSGIVYIFDKTVAIFIIAAGVFSYLFPNLICWVDEKHQITEKMYKKMGEDRTDKIQFAIFICMVILFGVLCGVIYFRCNYGR